MLRKEILCKTLSDTSKIDIMQQAVAPCLEIIMSIKGKPTRSLLDSGSEVTLVNKSYYKEHIEHRLLPSSGSYNNSHNLFSLQGIEEGHVPLSKHFECDIEVGGQLVHRVGILVKKDKIRLVDSKGRKAKTPALLGSNLIQWFWWEACYTGWMRDDLLITGLSFCRIKNLTFCLSCKINVYISVLSLFIGCSGSKKYCVLHIHGTMCWP